MIQMPKLAWFALGALLMSVPGLITERMRWAFFVLLAMGYVILIAATVRGSMSKPTTAIILAAATNIAFWLSYGLWMLRRAVAEPSAEAGIDPFAGPVAMWLLLFPTFLVYEAIVFVKGIVVNRERGVATIGMAAIVGQVLLTFRIIYRLIAGV
jgi:hypothetical protein